MFKLVVLSALLAVAAAKPGVWAPTAYSYGGYSPLAYSGYSAYAGYPAYSAYSAPAYSAYSAPAYSAYSAYSAPVVSAYSAHVPAVVAGEPALPHGVPAIATKATGKLVDTIDNVVARDNHLVAKALNYHGIHKRSVVSPLAYSGVYAHSPVVSAYSAAPVVSAYSAAPVVSAYSSPLVSAYSTPVVSSYSTSVVNPGHAYVAPAHAYGVHAW